jgi:molybdenum cofactor guanylyltransferase
LSLPQPEEAEKAAGFVLAGGQSSRMGRDKALLGFAGEPLIAHALRILSESGLQPAIAGARSTLSAFAPVVEDEACARGKGPLAGICAALNATDSQYAVFMPVDLPFIPSSLITCMLSHARLTGALFTVASLNGFPQTFPAVIDRQALDFLEGQLRSEERGCLLAFQRGAHSLSRPLSILPSELLLQSGQITHLASLPPFLWFLNLNSPLDFMRAERIANGGLRVS